MPHYLLHDPVILIAGGRDKGSDYQKLSPLVKKRVKLLLVMGEAANLMIRAWGDLIPAREVSSLNEAVFSAFNAAVPGDIVLFSPGCSSFDAFENFEHRGRVFKNAVHAFIRKRS